MATVKFTTSRTIRPVEGSDEIITFSVELSREVAFPPEYLSASEEMTEMRIAAENIATRHQCDLVMDFAALKAGGEQARAIMDAEQEIKGSDAEMRLISERAESFQFEPDWIEGQRQGHATRIDRLKQDLPAMAANLAKIPKPVFINPRQ